MAGPAEIRLEVIPWDAAAENHLSDLCDGSPGGLEAVALAVKECRSFAWGIFEGGERCGTIVSRTDAMHGGGFDFVIEYAYGRASIDLTAMVLPVIEAAARRIGAARMRIHTHRPGLANKLERAGYGLPEMVLVKGLA